MLEWLIRKTFKMVFMVLLAAGIYNFLKTPGDVTVKMAGAFIKTGIQAAEIIREGRVAVSESVSRHMSAIAEKRKPAPERKPENIALTFSARN
ncbi:MAG: hypothetical protein PHG91_05720 [Syntrophales bacterium]|nr:hypothetical protein [Syntrophales bacterium]MDD5533705.1 hypothetical protein [Syntrophales bacterium]HPL64532.1 hypothetical protein [Syntrophales bacterium]